MSGRVLAFSSAFVADSKASLACALACALVNVSDDFLDDDEAASFGPPDDDDVEEFDEDEATGEAGDASGDEDTAEEDPMDDEEAEVDRLIASLRSQSTKNYDEIMRALQPYIGQRVSRTCEEKLTRFIEELIAQRQREMGQVPPQMAMGQPPMGMPPYMQSMMQPGYYGMQQ